jgi:hypothetical protein
MNSGSPTNPYATPPAAFAPNAAFLPPGAERFARLCERLAWPPALIASAAGLFALLYASTEAAQAYVAHLAFHLGLAADTPIALVTAAAVAAPIYITLWMHLAFYFLRRFHRISWLYGLTLWMPLLNALPFVLMLTRAFYYARRAPVALLLLGICWASISGATLVSYGLLIAYGQDDIDLQLLAARLTLAHTMAAGLFLPLLAATLRRMESGRQAEGATVGMAN